MGDVLTGCHFETSGFAKTQFVLHAFVDPLYVPFDALNLTYGRRLGWRQGRWFDLSEESEDEAMGEALGLIQAQALPLFERFRTAADFARHAGELHSNPADPMFIEAVAYSQVLAGDYEKGRAGLAAVAVGAAVCACGDQKKETKRTSTTVPVSSVEAADDPGFGGRVPRLGRAEPADTLRLNRLFGDSVAFASISGIQPLGALLLVTDRLMSKHLAVIDLQSGAVQARTGGHGEGPNEFRDPGAFLVESITPARAWVYDFQNRRLSLLAAAPDGELAIEQSRPFNSIRVRASSSPCGSASDSSRTGSFPITR